MKAFDHQLLGIFRRLATPAPWSPPGVSLMAARRMWSSTRGEGAVVAILDTGIDYHHPDLRPNLIGGASLIAGESDCMDRNGHGTHVAGTVAANGKILGVAPLAKLLAVKVLDHGGRGTHANITAGLRYAREWKGPQGQRVNVVNMSLGGPDPDREMYDEIIRVINAGILVVCAAGNEGDDRQETMEIAFPAYYKETVAVGAVNLLTRAANFSNTNDRIDLVAPGIDTYSAYPGGRYVKLSGTSMAAPHISGAAALIYSRYKKRFGAFPTPGTVGLLLRYLSIDLGEAGFDELYGYGLFSFNIDGGKTILLTPGSNQYLINGCEHEWRNAPAVKGSIIQGPLAELSDMLGCDSDTTPAAGFLHIKPTKMQIWC